MRSVFRKRAKRNLTNGSLFLLTAVLFSLFLPRSGFTSGGIKQIEVAVKNPSLNGAALWVTNLGAHDTKLTIGTKPFDSTVTQERPYASEEIAAGKTVRLDDLLPPGLRNSNALFIRSHEEVATLIAPIDFPIHDAEFYSSPLSAKPQAVPKWVRELGAIGTTGNNVFKTDDTGYAPAVKGQTDVDKHYVFGVGVDFEKPNSSAEFKLIGRAGQELKSLVLSSSTRVYWQSRLGEFISGTNDYPSRIEMKVLSGTAQGFLSIKNDESGELTWLPIAPFAGAGSLQARSDDEGPVEVNLAAHPRRGGPRLEEESSLPLQDGSGGYAYFSNGAYDSKYSSYTYNVYGAPANVCGTLRLIRNGNPESTPGWICTNGSGEATKGPWTGSTNQTGQFISIRWPNGTTTVGGDYKVDDGSEPSIWPNQTPGFGVPIPGSFNGVATDVQWGTGFSWWTSVYGQFLNVTTSKYYNGQGYVSNTPVNIPGTFSPPTGFTISWEVPVPPVHNSTDTYEWCVYTNDLFYPTFACLFFYGPR